MERKTSGSAVTLKSAGPGGVAARLARLNVVDHDGDIVMPGSVRPGQRVMLSPWNHASMMDRGVAALPIGRGTVEIRGDYLELEAEFFDTAAARDARKVIEGLGSDLEWSWGYDVKRRDYVNVDGRQVRRLHELRVWEASPVPKAASIGTGTTEMRSSAEAERAELLAIARRHGVPAGGAMTDSDRAAAQKEYMRFVRATAALL